MAVFQVNVGFLDGSSQSATVTSATTAGELREQLELTRTLPPMHGLRLFRGTKELREDELLQLRVEVTATAQFTMTLGAGEDLADLLRRLERDAEVPLPGAKLSDLKLRLQDRGLSSAESLRLTAVASLSAEKIVRHLEEYGSYGDSGKVYDLLQQTQLEWQQTKRVLTVLGNFGYIDMHLCQALAAASAKHVTLVEFIIQQLDRGSMQWATANATLAEIVLLQPKMPLESRVIDENRKLLLTWAESSLSSVRFSVRSKMAAVRVLGRVGSQEHLPKLRKLQSSWAQQFLGEEVTNMEMECLEAISLIESRASSSAAPIAQAPAAAAACLGAASSHAPPAAGASSGAVEAASLEALHRLALEQETKLGLALRMDEEHQAERESAEFRDV